VAVPVLPVKDLTVDLILTRGPMVRAAVVAAAGLLEAMEETLWEVPAVSV
jgi:hypothetical protein